MMTQLDPKPQPKVAGRLLSELHGVSCSPRLIDQGSSANKVLVRYIYDGGVLRHGRLCALATADPDGVSGKELLECLQADGVDLNRFEAFAYESEESGGGWWQLLNATHVPLAPASDAVAQTYPHIPRTERDDRRVGEPPRRRRVDVKLYRRDAPSREAALAHASSRPCGDIALEGYFGIGVHGAKTERNVGTLWRSAYQLGAAFLFTIGHRYESAPTDTLKVPLRLPYYAHADWSRFAELAPADAVWVAVEMGGDELLTFEHPERAVYILGSEDNGLPDAVVRACHRHVALPSARYDSYNVAAAGSIVMYDRAAKLARRESVGRPRRKKQQASGPPKPH